MFEEKGYRYKGFRKVIWILWYKGLAELIIKGVYKEGHKKLKGTLYKGIKGVGI